MSKLITFIVTVAVLLSVCNASTVIDTYAGDNSIAGTYNGDNGPATSAGIDACGIAFDSSDNMYIAGSVNPKIRKVTYSTGDITTFAGTGGTYSSASAGDGGAATSALFQMPFFVYVDPSDKYLYITDIGSSTNNIRRVDLSTNVITLYAGDLTKTVVDNVQATNTKLCYPQGMRRRKSVFYFADNCNHAVRMIDTSGVITTFAGTLGSSGHTGDGAAATSAKISKPSDLAFDSSGNMYIAESGLGFGTSYSYIRKVDATTNVITTVAGSAASSSTGDGGSPLIATFKGLWGITVDCFDNVYVSDVGFNTINNVRVIDFTADTIDAYAGVSGGAAGAFAGDGGAATSASFEQPYQIAFDSSNNFYVADYGNAVVRRVTGNPSASGCPADVDDDGYGASGGSGGSGGSSGSGNGSSSDSSDSSNSLYGLIALIAILPLCCITYFFFGVKRDSKEKKEPVKQVDIELPEQYGVESAVVDASVASNNI